jgi:FMN phosphatase YigB (HAD superfamily)
MSTAPLEVVFFDVGGTLVRVEPSVGSVYARFAHAHGFELDPAAIQRAFAKPGPIA